MVYREAAGPSENIWRITEGELLEARRVVDAHALRTPLVPAPSIDPRVWLKLETRQHTGSFKVRGALAKLASLARAERSGPIVTASAGNHGHGVAFAAGKLGMEVKVFVPKNTPRVKLEGMRSRGAEVVVTEEAGYDATEALAREEVEREGGVFVSPYDDSTVAAGNGGTVGQELFGLPAGAEGLGSTLGMGEVGALVVPVGGGGLVCGLAAARDHVGSGAKLVGINCEASPGMARSFAEGRTITELPHAETLAEGLEGGVSPSTYTNAMAAGVEMHTVGEDAIAEAMRFAKHTLGERVEGSAAAGLAWVRANLGEIPGTAPVVVILTGANVDDARWDAL